MTMQEDCLPDFIPRANSMKAVESIQIPTVQECSETKVRRILDEHFGGAEPAEVPCLRHISPAFYDDPLVLNPHYQDLCLEEAFVGSHLKVLLKLLETNGGFDDLIVATTEFINRKHAKRLMKLLNHELSQNELEGVVREIFGTNGDKVINKVSSPGEDHDDAYEFYCTDDSGEVERYRYRINVSSFQEKMGRQGLAVTIRRLTTKPKTLVELGASQYIIDNCTPRTGLVLICGETGSGKSTLLHIIALLDKPSSGEIFYRKKNFSQSNDNEKDLVRQKGISIIYQQNNLLSDFTVLENVLIPLLNNGYSLGESTKRAMKTLSLVHLSGRLNHFPSELSKGLRNRDLGFPRNYPC